MSEPLYIYTVETAWTGKERGSLTVVATDSIQSALEMAKRPESSSPPIGVLNVGKAYSTTRKILTRIHHFSKAEDLKQYAMDVKSSHREEAKESESEPVHIYVVQTDWGDDNYGHMAVVSADSSKSALDIAEGGSGEGYDIMKIGVTDDWSHKVLASILYR